MPSSALGQQPLDTTWKQYLGGIEDHSKPLTAAAAVENLDSATSYTADQLRDKIIEVITALKTST